LHNQNIKDKKKNPILIATQPQLQRRSLEAKKVIEKSYYQS